MSLLDHTFRSLSHRNYRLYFTGQGLSLVGTWIQTTVQGWLVYSLSKSSFALGLVGFCSQAPGLVLGLYAGVLADRFDRRRALMLTQTVAMAQAAALGVLTLSGTVQVWHIMLLSALAGIAVAFDMPLRQSFAVELVGPRDLGNALALNSMAFNAARIIGPALSGFLVGWVGEGACFLINAASFLFVLRALHEIRLPPKVARQTHPPAWQSLKEGLRYCRDMPFIRNPIILLSAVSLVIMPLMLMLPVFAVEQLNGGPKTYGMLISSIGVGALLGGVTLASRKKHRRMGGFIVVSSFLYGGSMLALSFVHGIWPACLLLLFAGMGMMRQNVGSNTLIQSLVRNEMRGRVMSVYVMTFVGFAPLGSLILGKLSQHFGIAVTMRAGAVWCLVAAVWFVSRIEEMRRAAMAVPEAALEDNGEKLSLI